MEITAKFLSINCTIVQLYNCTTVQLAIANDAEDRKRNKYATSLSPSFIFVPIAVETFGVLGDAASEFMYELGKRISAVSGEPDPDHFSCNVWVSQSSEEMLRVFLEQLIRLLIWMLFFIYELHVTYRPVYIETHLVIIIIRNCLTK